MKPFRIRNDAKPRFSRRKRVWKRYIRHRRGLRARKHPSILQACTLAEVPPGYRALIAGFSHTIPANRKEHLMTYGLLPGYWVKVMQQVPVTVVQIEHTDLALERALAYAIQVEDISSGE